MSDTVRLPVEWPQVMPCAIEPKEVAYCLYVAQQQRHIDELKLQLAAAEIDAALWHKHKDSFAVLEAVLNAASPLVLNRLKAQDAVADARA